MHFAFSFGRDMILPCFMYLNLFFLSSWRYKKQVILTMGVCVTLLHMAVLYFAGITLSLPDYELARGVLQFGLFILSVFFMEGEGPRTLVPLISAASVVTVCSTMGSLSVEFISGEMLSLVVYFFFQLVGVLLVAFLLRGPFLQMMRELDRGLWIVSCGAGIPILYCTLMGVYPGILPTGPIRMVSIVGVSAMIIANHVMVFALYRTIRRQAQVQEERHVLEVQLVATQIQINKINENKEDLRILAHDIRHYANLITAKIRSGDIPGALEVSDRLRAKTDAVDTKSVQYSNNFTVNLLLNYYADKAASLQAQCRIKVNPSTELPCNETELAVMLSNCFENALNAISKIPEGVPRLLRVVLHFGEAQFFAEITNSVHGTIIFDPITRLPTTSATGHGVGMYSIDSFVRSHGGVLHCKQEGQLFSVSIVVVNDEIPETAPDLLIEN